MEDVYVLRTVSERFYWHDNRLPSTAFLPQVIPGYGRRTSVTCSNIVWRHNFYALFIKVYPGYSDANRNKSVPTG